MKYYDGQDIQLGDRVALGDDSNGVVVCLLDTGEFSANCPAAEWAYLKHGVIIDFPMYGRIHYDDVESDVQLIARS